MLREGTSLVEVRAISTAEPDVLTRSAQLPPPVLYVQAGAYSDQNNARRVLDRLHAGGLTNAFIVSPVVSTTDSTPGLYKVRVGPIGSVPEFDQLAARLSVLGFPDARLVTD